MKFKDKIKAKENRQAKEALKECFRRDWKKSEGDGWITERTYRVRRTKAKKLLPSFAFLTPFPTLLNPQPSISPPPIPQSLHFKLLHKVPVDSTPITPSQHTVPSSQHETIEHFKELSSHGEDSSHPTTQSSPHEIPSAKETSKEEIERHIVEKPIEEEEELHWDAVKIMIEADGTSFYGLGEIAGSLQLNDLAQNLEDLDFDHESRNPCDDDPYYHPPESEHDDKSPYKQRRSRKGKKGITICWNTDVGLYSHLNPSLYQSHPFLISLLRDGSANAYYLDSTYLTIVHLSKVKDEEGKVFYQLLFLSRSKNAPPLYIIHAKSPQEIAQEITRLFGSVALPPKWAIGYQQCRYSYYPDSRVLTIAESFRKYNIPCDVIWMDIHYMNEYRCFQFSPRHFPDPPRLSDSLHSLGFHGVWMIDPGIKVDEGYEVFRSGLKGDHFTLKQSPKDPLDPFDIVDIEHVDDPPALEEYPEIKEAESIIDVIEEPGFNRAPDLEDQYSDSEDYQLGHHPHLPPPGGVFHETTVVDTTEVQTTPVEGHATQTPSSHVLTSRPLTTYGDALKLTKSHLRREIVISSPLIAEESEGEDDLKEKVVMKPKRFRKLEELEIGKVWPGDCVFPDFTRKDTRKWWGALYTKFLNKNGIDGVWNDMNEVASFGEGGTIHRKSWHRADRELGGPDDHSRYHNVYGFLMTLATKQGMRHARKDRREFVLTRANFMGGHRHAATWTGDNTSNWDHLGWTVPMIINLSLSGQLFCGADIGGFFGDATAELFARWMGFGCLLPFARAHSCVRTRNHEPWSFGNDVKRICKKAIERRYKLLGYYYTLFYESSFITSLPILQPLFYQSPSDQRLRDVDSVFTIGSSVLVVTDLHPPPSHSIPSSPSSHTSTPSSSVESSPLTSDEREEKKREEERKREERKREEEKRKEEERKAIAVSLANPMTDDEDMVTEDEHLTEETAEEEEERRRIWNGRGKQDRFPSDLLDRDNWIRFHILDDFSDQYETELPEMYLKRGCIVPLITLSQYVLPASQYFTQPLTLAFALSYPSADFGVAEGTLYEDEGDSYAYQTMQVFNYVKFRIERTVSTHTYPDVSLRHSKDESFSPFSSPTPSPSLSSSQDVKDETKEETKEETTEDEGEKITVYMIYISNSSTFICDRPIIVREITHENADQPKPLFEFQQTQFEEAQHPSYPTHKVYSYVHHISSPKSVESQ